jgi:hypothetical protein
MEPPARSTLSMPTVTTYENLDVGLLISPCREVIFIRLYSTGVTKRSSTHVCLDTSAPRTNLEWKESSRREPLVLPLETTFEGLMFVS